MSKPSRIAYGAAVLAGVAGVGGLTGCSTGPKDSKAKGKPQRAGQLTTTADDSNVVVYLIQAADQQSSDTEQFAQKVLSHLVAGNTAETGLRVKPELGFTPPLITSQDLLSDQRDQLVNFVDKYAIDSTTAFENHASQKTIVALVAIPLKDPSGKGPSIFKVEHPTIDSSTPSRNSIVWVNLHGATNDPLKLAGVIDNDLRELRKSASKVTLPPISATLVG